MSTTSPPSKLPPEHGKLDQDHISSKPGERVIGTGTGAVAGGVAGFAVGSFAGPVGAVVGTVLGAVIGGNAGKDANGNPDRSAEESYWRENHDKQPYATEGRGYSDYARAYETGYTGYRKGETFDDREAALRMEYEGDPQRIERDDSAEAGQRPPLRWEDVSPAVRAAYDRVEGDEVPPSVP